GLYAKNSLENVTVGGLLAGLGRLGAVDKGSRIVIRAGGRGNLVGGLVQGQLNYPLGRSKRLYIRVIWQVDCPFHELGPDGQRNRRAAKVNITVVIVTHPHNAEQVGGKTGKPSIVGASGLAGGRSGELASSSSGRARSRAVIDHALQHVSD